MPIGSAVGRELTGHWPPTTLPRGDAKVLCMYPVVGCLAHCDTQKAHSFRIRLYRAHIGMI